MDKFRCILCEKIETYVHLCGRKHLVCERCVDKKTQKLQPLLCSCGSELLDRERNPLDKLIEEKCSYRDCTYTLSSEDMPNHMLECRYRPYKCLGYTLKIWECDWSGRQLDLAEHLATAHPELGAVLPHNATDRIPFDAKQTMGTINLVSAFSRHFVFFYYTDAATQMVSFVVFLLGRNSTAAHFYVEFQLNYGSTMHERIEFVTPCVSDSTDIHAMIAEERCIALTHRTVKKYVCDDGCLRFRFFVKEKSMKKTVRPVPPPKLSENVSSLEPAKSTSAPEPARALKKGFVVAANLPKKSNTSVVSTCKISLQHKPLSSRVPAIGSDMLQSLSISARPRPTPRQPPTTPPQQQQQVTFNEPPSPVVPQLTNPATLTCNAGRSFGHKVVHQPMFRPQPYKAIDDKFYTVRYPNTSITKPVYKK